MIELSFGEKGFGGLAGGAVAKLVLDEMGVDVIGFTIEPYRIKAKPLTYEDAKVNYRKNELNYPGIVQ